MRMQFGKYRGAPHKPTPTEYLEWLTTIDVQEPCESMGGKCCDCEIYLNVSGGENDTNLEIHHSLVDCESVVSVEDVHRAKKIEVIG